MSFFNIFGGNIDTSYIGATGNPFFGFLVTMGIRQPTVALKPKQDVEGNVVYIR